MTERFYTEQRLNAEEEGVLNIDDFIGGRYIAPMDMNAIASIPGPLGALTLPPQGVYTTPANLDYANEGLMFGMNALPDPQREHRQYGGGPILNPPQRGDPIAIRSLDLYDPYGEGPIVQRRYGPGPIIGPGPYGPGPIIEPHHSGDPIAIHALSLEQRTMPLVRPPLGLDPAALGLQEPVIRVNPAAMGLDPAAQGLHPCGNACANNSMQVIPMLALGAAALYFLAVPV